MTLNKIANHSSALASASVILAISGLWRDRLLAATFGAGQILDAYQIAFILPDLIFNLFIVGAISASFIPIFSSFLSSPKKASEIIDTIFTFFSLSILAILAVIYFLAPSLVDLLESFSHLIGQVYPAQSSPLVVRLTRLMLLSPFFLGLSTIATSILHCRRHFLLPAASPLVYNLSIIGGIFLLVPRFGIYGVALGVIIGAGGHFLIQIPSLLAAGVRFKPRLRFSKAVKDIIILSIPRTLSLVATQASFWINKIIAFTLGAGAVSVYYFANNLQYIAVGLFGISLAVAAFPNLSDCSENRVKFIKTFSKSFRQILFFTVPASILFLLLRAQIVRLVLGAGRFDWEDTILTANTLGYFALSIFAQSLVILLSRAFYALKDSKTPFVINFLSLAINLILSLYFIKKLGVIGLALSFSLAIFFNFFWLLFALYRRVGDLEDRRLILSSLKTILASLAMGTTVYFTLHIVSWLVDMQRAWGILIQTTAAGAVGLTIFWLVSLLIDNEEAHDIWSRLGRVFLRSRL